MNLELAVHTYGGRIINADKALVCCPVHDDSTPSLSLTNSHKELWQCFAGCDQTSVFEALKNSGVIESRSNNHVQVNRIKPAKTIKRSPKKHVEPIQCNAETYYKHTGLCEETVDKFGGRFTNNGLEMDYFLAGDKTAYTKTRRCIEGQPKYTWASNMPKPAPYIYGLQYVKAFASKGHKLNVVEGESDAQTLWANELAAVGISGANAIRPDLVEVLRLFETVYIFKEPDQGGEKFVKGVSSLDKSLLVNTKVNVIHLPKEIKDINKLYTMDKDKFKENYYRMLEA